MPHHKPPFIGGLRTGYVRVWLFVAMKVLFITSIFGGYNWAGKLEENVSLLDRLVRNDFTVQENYVVRHHPNAQAKSDDGHVASASITDELTAAGPRGPEKSRQ